MRRARRALGGCWDAAARSPSGQVADTAGAIRAYRHYLALRENPDPPWRAPWDSVRAELAALVRR